MNCKYEAKILADGWQRYSLENYHEIDSKHNTRNQGLRLSKIFIHLWGMVFQVFSIILFKNVP